MDRDEAVPRLFRNGLKDPVLSLVAQIHRRGQEIGTCDQRLAIILLLDDQREHSLHFQNTLQ